MTKKEILESMGKEMEALSEGGSFVFGYGTGNIFVRCGTGDIRDILLLCEQIKIDAFNKQAEARERNK